MMDGSHTDFDIDPMNIDAEQAVLGALLLNNKLLDHVPSLAIEHFYDPVHGKVIFKAIQHLIGRGKIASIVTLKTLIGANSGLATLGGPEYLARLAGSATSLGHIRDYAQIIIDTHAQRQLLTAVGKTRDLIQEQTDLPVGDVIGELEADLVDIQSSSSVLPAVIKYSDAFNSALTSIDKAFKSDESGTGISTGLRSLDRVIGGFFKGETTVIAGRPSMGKTTVGLAIANKIAKPPTEDEMGVAVIVASIEMTVEQLQFRTMSSLAYDRGVKIEYNRLRTGDMTDAEYRRLLTEGLSDPVDAPIRYVGQNNGRAINTLLGEIRTAARSLPNNVELGAVVIDYLGQIKNPKSTGNRVNDIGFISGELRELAKSLKTHIVILSQLNRLVDGRPLLDRRPVLSDLRDSGDVEQDADNVVFVYRDAHYLQQYLKSLDPGDDRMMRIMEKLEACRDEMELIVSKNRNGAIGTARVKCDLPFNIVKDREENPNQGSFGGFK